jgi:hypothetical protein
MPTGFVKKKQAGHCSDELVSGLLVFHCPDFPPARPLKCLQDVFGNGLGIAVGQNIGVKF